MSTTSFLSFLNSQMAAGSYPTCNQPNLVRRTVTISHQAGCGSRAIGEKLAALISVREPQNARPWQVFDRN